MLCLRRGEPPTPLMPLTAHERAHCIRMHDSDSDCASVLCLKVEVESSHPYASHATIMALTYCGEGRDPAACAAAREPTTRAGWKEKETGLRCEQAGAMLVHCWCNCWQCREHWQCREQPCIGNAENRVEQRAGYLFVKGDLDKRTGKYRRTRRLSNVIQSQPPEKVPMQGTLPLPYLHHGSQMLYPLCGQCPELQPNTPSSQELISTPAAICGGC
eukprot:1154376-Pelagomonas_calceolata.AAC.1